jgi:aspartyl-tRNA(Asn)/glutamyl-tRNA(Gln) amidotransferase subunit B
MSKLDVIIGLEIHTELKTASKMFCSCANQAATATPNQNCCPICLGHPGTLPAVNAEAVNFGLRLALALEAKINLYSKFDRKNYFYPDLPKGYQISQYDLPLAEGGSLKISPNREIAITRLHLEEDTGKLSHQSDSSLVDYNRAGVPLIELVTEPVIASAAEAKLFAKRFQATLRSLGISEADMEKGLMRCEANVSVQTPGSWSYSAGRIEATGDQLLNHKVEVKNINSFKALERAIEFEIERQSELVATGQKVEAQTRGWNEQQNATVAQRRKETQADYRYFPEPDLPPLSLNEADIEAARSQVAELPHQKAERLADEHGLNDEEITYLLDNNQLANYFEETVSELYTWMTSEGDDWQRQKRKLAKTAFGWLTTELSKLMTAGGIAWEYLKVTPAHLAELIKLSYKNQINSSAAQTILAQLFEHGGTPEALMRELGLEQLDDKPALEELINKVLAENPSQAADFRSGKIALARFFVGKAMAASGGKANPQILEEILNSIINK